MNFVATAKPALEMLFEARTIAMIGPSKRSALAAGMARRLELDGFAGPVWMVTPSHTEIFGHRCFGSMRDLPGAPDLVIVGVSAAGAAGVLEEAADAGAKAAIVISTGFADAGEEGRQLGSRLAAVALERGISLCGPGSFGYSIPSTGLSPFGEGPRQRMPEGRVGVVAQSGGFANILSLAAIERGFGFSYLIASGSESVLTAGDYLSYIVEDERTKILVTIVEEIRNAALFIGVVRRATSLGKPTIVLSLGRSVLGQRVTSAHSGALSSRADVQEAYFRAAGAIVVTSLDDLVETIVLLNSWQERIASRARPLVLSISGGDCGLVADLADDANVEIPALSAETQMRLKALLPESTLVDNPIDLGTRPLVEPALGIEVLRAAASDDRVNMILYRLSGDSNDFPALAAACGKLQKPLAFFTRMALALDQTVVAAAKAADIPVLQGVDRALGALKRAVEWARVRDALSNVLSLPRPECGLQPQLERLGSSARRSETEALEILREAGIPVVESRPARSGADAVIAARAFGFPVALKIDSPDIEHKSDIGGVRLGLFDEKAVTDAFDEVTRNARAARPDAELRGAVVQPMLSPTVELILGSVADARFGPVVIVGIGGVLAEVFRRREILVPPVTEEEALAAITRLLAPDAESEIDWRGLPVETAANAVKNFSELVIRSARWVEAIDVNPLGIFRDPPGALALDCVIKTRSADAHSPAVRDR